MLKKSSQNERYTIIELRNSKHYVFDKYIFSVFIILLLCTFFIIVILNGGLNADNNFYVKCNNTENKYFLNGSMFSTGCENPLYHEYKYCNSVWAGACEQEFIPNGFTYGTPPPKFFLWFNLITFFGLIVSFVLNHLFYNRNVKFKDLGGNDNENNL